MRDFLLFAMQFPEIGAALAIVAAVFAIGLAAIGYAFLEIGAIILDARRRKIERAKRRARFARVFR